MSTKYLITSSPTLRRRDRTWLKLVQLHRSNLRSSSPSLGLPRTKIQLKPVEISNWFQLVSIGFNWFQLVSIRFNRNTNFPVETNCLTGKCLDWLSIPVQTNWRGQLVPVGRQFPVTQLVPVGRQFPVGKQFPVTQLVPVGRQFPVAQLVPVRNQFPVTQLVPVRKQFLVRRQFPVGRH